MIFCAYITEFPIGGSDSRVIWTPSPFPSHIVRVTEGLGYLFIIAEVTERQGLNVLTLNLLL